jgi:hypothetical protein
MQTVPFKIERLISMARSHHLVIPEFQRPFVWNEAQVRKLVDSVARGYPIGSILLLRRSEIAKFADRKIDAVESPPDPDDIGVEKSPPAKSEDNEVYYILDGQQRVTSLIRVFANAHPKGRYYIDISALRALFGDHDDCDEAAPWFVFDRPRHKPQAATRASKQPTASKREGLQYLKTQKSLNSKLASILVDEYFDDAITDPKLRREGRATVSAILETVRNFEVPAVIMDEKSGLEAICRVFETINSTGTKLTTFDLATAKFYPKPNLRTLWTASLEQRQILGQFEVDGERVLQIISLWSSHFAGKRPEASRSHLLALDGNEIAKHWNDAVGALARACEWVQARGVLDRKHLPNEAILIPLGAILSQSFWRTSRIECPNGFHDLLETWFWRSSLARTFEASTNERVASEFGRLLELLQTGNLIFEQHLVMSTATLISIRAQRDSRAKTLMSFILWRGPTDIKTGQSLNPQSEVESHHIFPKSLVKAHSNVESVINRVWVLRETNRDLSNKSPHDYLMTEIESARTRGHSEKLHARFASQFIPIEALELEERERGKSNVEEVFSLFLQARAELILERLGQELGKQYLQISKSDDEPEIEDDID